MPFKRSQSQYNGLEFWQYTWKGEPVFIRLAWNGAALISDLSVLRDGVKASGAHRLFNLHFCKFLILSNFRHWPKFLILLCTPAAQPLCWIVTDATVLNLYSTHQVAISADRNCLVELTTP